MERSSLVEGRNGSHFFLRGLSPRESAKLLKDRMMQVVAVDGGLQARLLSFLHLFPLC